MIDPRFKNLTPEQALELIENYEKEIGRLLREGKMDEWSAWECYFSLMYESNLRSFQVSGQELEKFFLEVRERLAGKINKEKFNPFLSKKPEIILIARDIAARNGLNTRLDN